MHVDSCQPGLCAGKLKCSIVELWERSVLNYKSIRSIIVETDFINFVDLLSTMQDYFRYVSVSSQ